MTTQELIDMLRNSRFARDAGVDLTPWEIQESGTLAQQQICDEIRAMSDITVLAIDPDTERYEPTQQKVVAITDAAPISVEVTAHGYQTGDQVYLFGTDVDAINRRWTITKVDADNFTLDGSTIMSNTANIWENAYVIHSLSTVIEIDAVRKLTPYKGEVQKRLPSEVEFLRKYYKTAVHPDKILYYYEIWGDILTFGLLGESSESDLKLEIYHFFQPSVAHNLSDVVNPVLPRRFDKLLYWQTQVNIIHISDQQALTQKMELAEAKLAKAKEETRDSIGMSRLKRVRSHPTLEWG